MATDPIYQIHLKEHLSAQWAEWFDPLRIEYAANGETRLVGPIRDQSELYGLLMKVRDLNLTLLAVLRGR